ncbi:pseudouridine synthase [Crucibulum laeve]|uniref:Pseudouridine synthase n=1 Tax=Crucibulum laeve TaxID=68775 RepID=A0A5C3MG99_9AGAR|nr:pseudouridine synthase [Crucibulum laeve]
MSAIVVHEREQDDADVERYAKRPKTDDTESTSLADLVVSAENSTPEHILPPSHVLLGVPLPVAKDGTAINFLETDVGISEYVGRGEAKIEGIIKQRFTDFLVYEVDLDGRVIHLKSLGKPESPKRDPAEPTNAELSTTTAADDVQMEGVESKPETAASGPGGTEEEISGIAGLIPADTSEKSEQPTNSSSVDAPAVEVPESAANSEKGKSKAKAPSDPWPEHFTTSLSPFISKEAIAQVKKMYLEGPEPPRVSDSGWGGRTPKAAGEGENAEEPTSLPEEFGSSKDFKGRDPGGRGRRGGRGGARGGRGGGGREDHRKVLSEPIDSKDTRTAFHKVVRELFQGKLETETDSSAPVSGDGTRIAIKWGRRGGGRSGRGGRGAAPGRGERAPRGTYPPYIHFTLQKTNRDTQDALGHLSRSLHVNVRDLSVAGTKDKRGVTVQRVSLKRNNKTVEEVWKQANGLTGRKSPQDALIQRGERGIRIADLNYRRASLELGMLKGNAFVITLRSVKVESMDILDEAMNTIKTKGFINYYGMQRFGTASVPTHSIGLALLKSEWQKAVSMILQKRHGEHPEVTAAREAWLVGGDLDKALQLMPRRVVAERCILESFKKQKGDTRNAMGALSTIPRNLRLMYIHAYQSYVWNAIVSERIRTYGAEKPIAGDLVFDTSKPEEGESMDVDAADGAAPIEEKGEAEEEEEDTRGAHKKSRKPYVAPRIKTLTEEDLDKYTIFDVIMPLPGTDVAYPGGKLGERYREFLQMDSLDPDNFVRKQKDYTLNGSYRAMLHLPKEMSWSVLRYTDPDVSLAQSDEDKLLGFDPPAVVEDGKFMALQIHLQLGTAAYATMALREITKTETSSHFQTNLTANSEDQKYRGAEAATTEGAEEVVVEESV